MLARVPQNGSHALSPFSPLTQGNLIWWFSQANPEKHREITHEKKLRKSRSFRSPKFSDRFSRPSPARDLDGAPWHRCSRALAPRGSSQHIATHFSRSAPRSEPHSSRGRREVERNSRKPRAVEKNSWIWMGQSLEFFESQKVRKCPVHPSQKKNYHLWKKDDEKMMGEWWVNDVQFWCFVGDNGRLRDWVSGEELAQELVNDYWWLSELEKIRKKNGRKRFW